MGNKEYLNVNELATLFGLNVQTLHYYDKIGILKPSYRDPKNGYRNIVLTRPTSWHPSAICESWGIPLTQCGTSRIPKVRMRTLKKAEGAFRSHSCPVGGNDADRPGNPAKNPVYRGLPRMAIDYENFQTRGISGAEVHSHWRQRMRFIRESPFTFTRPSFFTGKTSKEFGALLTDDIPGRNGWTAYDSRRDLCGGISQGSLRADSGQLCQNQGMGKGAGPGGYHSGCEHH